MAKYILEQIKIDGELQELLAKSNADNVAVHYKDADTTLTAALAGIIADLAALPTDSDLSSAISAAIDALIGGAPDTYDTLKEIADYIAEHEDVVSTLNAAIGNKADKAAFEAVKATVDALGALASKSQVSESDLDAALKEKVNAAAQGNHSHANKTVLDGITEEKVSHWDGLRGVRYGSTVPEDMQDGELFVKVVQ